MPRQYTPSLVLCSAVDERHLNRVVDELVFRGIEHVVFREPDLNNQMTAVATAPLDEVQRRRLSKHKLWGTDGSTALQRPA